MNATSASPSLRALTAPDLDAWYALQDVALPDPYSREALATELESSLTRAIGLFEGPRLCAAVLAWLVVDELQIMTVVVDPDARRRGYGRRIVGHLLRMAVAAGATHATLEVRVGNVAAIGLYEGLGFVRDGVRPRYYPDGEDALLMHHALASATVAAQGES